MTMFTFLLPVWRCRPGRHPGKLRSLGVPTGRPSLEHLEDRNLLSIWTTVHAMPTALAFIAGAASSDGRVFAFDGSDNAHALFKTIQAYTPSTDSWSVVGMMNTARDGVAAAAGLDGKIYVLGGS